MKQVIKFKSDEEHYKADACVVWCFDDRFTGLLGELNKFGWKNVDLVKVAGGAKGLAEEIFGGVNEAPGVRFIEDQILKSIKLHNTKLIILMIHRDCGAYGDLFKTHKDPVDYLKNQLRTAGKNLKVFLALENYYDVKIMTVFADFDGLWEV